eukprot:2930523-Rhodomonas_salina.1
MPRSVATDQDLEVSPLATGRQDPSEEVCHARRVAASHKPLPSRTTQDQCAGSAHRISTASNKTLVYAEGRAI